MAADKVTWTAERPFAIKIRGADANYDAQTNEKLHPTIYRTRSSIFMVESILKSRININRVFLWERSQKNNSSSSSRRSDSKSTFIDLNAKIYRNPNTELEIWFAKEQRQWQQQAEKKIVSEQKEKEASRKKYIYKRKKEKKRNSSIGKLVLLYIEMIVRLDV